MKKIIFALLAGVIMLNISSCMLVDQGESYSIKDALKISAWVLDDDLDGDGYWLRNGIGPGQWVEKSGNIITENGESDVFVFKRLKLNEVRILNPLNWRNLDDRLNYYNVNIFIEFDGLIEVTLDEGEKYMLLGYDHTNPTSPAEGVGSSQGNFTVPFAVFASFVPNDDYYDVSIENGKVVGSHYYTGRNVVKMGMEYYLNINAYKITDTEKAAPVVRARLKFKVIEDRGLKFEKDASESANIENFSRFLSVELISYEYNDMYKLMEDNWD